MINKFEETKDDLEPAPLEMTGQEIVWFDIGREIMKVIAIITMTVDHVGVIIFPEYTFLRIIGRFAFPLFSYLLILGIKSTRNVKNYFKRLFLFALLSQVPFYLALGIKPYEAFNIFFTLSFGILAVHLFKKKSLLTVLPVLTALFLNFDHSFYGILLIVGMYVLDNNIWYGIVSIVSLNILFFPLWYTQLFSLLALPIILLYKKGALKVQREVTRKNAYPVWRKYFFYLYYPVHLTALHLIKLFYLS